MPQDHEPPPALPSSPVQGLTHELNDQLSIVLANAEAALSSEDPEEMKRALRIVVESSTAMAATVRTFARSSPAAALAGAMRRTEPA